MGSASEGMLQLDCNKTGCWPALFLTFPLHLWQSLHYFALLYITWGIFPYFTLHVCALWWQVVISLSRLLCGIQPRWLCGPYHDLLCVWELLLCHSLSVRTVVTPFSILWESSMTCAVRTLCFSFMLTEQLYVCPTLHYPILYFVAAAILYSMCTLLYTTLFSTLLYVCLTLHNPILGCGHTLSLRRCGDCLICVFLILYLYNVVSGDCGPHFVFTPRILRVTWVSKPLLTLPLPTITTTRHYHYSTLHDLPI